MKLYQLFAKQELPITLEQAWDFLSNPVNLKTITPDYMGFDILSGADSNMFPGQIIQYNVTPVAGVKARWVTEITHVKHLAYFVDEQRFGPYQLWHHKHFIEKTANGVLMTDMVDYKLPAGIIGQMVHPILVKPKLQEIFNYRAKKLNQLFGTIPNSNVTLEIKTI